MRRGGIYSVLIRVPGGFLGFGESFYLSAIRQENLGPSGVMVVEDYRTHASTFDQEHIMIVVPVHIKCRQASLTRDILKVDCVRLDGCLVVFRCIRHLRESKRRRHQNTRKQEHPRALPTSLRPSSE